MRSNIHLRYQSAISLLDTYFYSEIKISVYNKNLCVSVYGSFVSNKTANNSNVPQLRNGYTNCGYIRLVEYSAMKVSGMMTHHSFDKSKCISINERSQTL